MSNQYNHTGIECTVSYWDSPDTVVDAIVIFGEAPETDNEDDDRVFYYLNDTEVKWLYTCVEQHRDKCAFGGEWFIDLVDDYGFIVGNEVTA